MTTFAGFRLGGTAALFGSVPLSIERLPADVIQRDAVADRQRAQLFVPVRKKRTPGREKSAGPQSERFHEQLIEFAFTGGNQKMEIKPQRMGRVLGYHRVT